MALAKLSLAQASLLIHLRSFGGSEQVRKDMKADLFKLVKDAFGIPHDHKLSVEIDNASSPDFLVLKRKKNGMPYNLGADGRWVEASQPVAPPAPVMHDYRVVWEIDHRATDPQSAAREVFDRYFQGGHSADHFTVTSADGESTDVDLSEDIDN